MGLLLASFILMVCLQVKAQAVWPPTTSLEEPVQQAPSQNSFESEYRPAPRPRGIYERLDDDKRRLKGVLQDLETDTRDLKKSAVKSDLTKPQGE